MTKWSWGNMHKQKPFPRDSKLTTHILTYSGLKSTSVFGIPVWETYYRVNSFHIVLWEPFTVCKEQLSLVCHVTSPDISSLLSFLSDVFLCISSADVYLFFTTIKLHILSENSPHKKRFKNPFKNILEESVDERQNKEI